MIYGLENFNAHKIGKIFEKGQEIDRCIFSRLSKNCRAFLLTSGGLTHL